MVFNLFVRKIGYQFYNLPHGASSKVKFEGYGQGFQVKFQAQGLGIRV